MSASASIILSLAVLAQPAAAPRLVFAAPLAEDAARSPRRLFNAALSAEERGDLAQACQLYLAVRLARREAFADRLYARGAAIRLVRLLAERDEDAAAAAAMLVAGTERFSDLGPLIKLLKRRVEGPSGTLELLTGTIISTRYRRHRGTVHVEFESDGGETRVLAAAGMIGPFSSGQRVRVLVRPISGRAGAAWRIVAMSARNADGWQLLRVRGLPGAALSRSGALLGKQRRSGKSKRRRRL